MSDIATMDAEHAAGFDIEDLYEALSDGAIEAADGCMVEADGVCSHGHQSPMRVLGYI